MYVCTSCILFLGIATDNAGSVARSSGSQLDQSDHFGELQCMGNLCLILQRLMRVSDFIVDPVLVYPNCDYI